MKPLLDAEVIPEDMDVIDGELDELSESDSSIDPIQMYLNEIRRNPRITPEQERVLGETINQGRQAAAELHAIGSAQECGDALDSDPRVVLMLKENIRAGDYAKRKLVEYHMRSAAYFAMKFKGCGIAMLDLIQDANIALMRATENWNYDPQCKFSSFAAVYIKKTLQGSCNRQSVIHISDSMNKAINKVRRVFNSILRELGHPPTPEDVALEMNMPVAIAEDILAATDLAKSPLMLDAPMGEDGGCSMFDFVPDTTADAPEEAAIQTMLHETIIEILRTLEPTEEKVIKLHFGIDDGYARPVEEVCRECRAEKEEVIRAEIMALRKLRHPSRSRQLQGFLC